MPEHYEHAVTEVRLDDLIGHHNDLFLIDMILESENDIMTL